MTFEVNPTTLWMALNVAGWNFSSPNNSLTVHLEVDVAPEVIHYSFTGDGESIILGSGQNMTTQINFHPFGVADRTSVEPVSYSFDEIVVPNSSFDMGINLPYFQSDLNIDFSFHVAQDCAPGYVAQGNECFPCPGGTYSEAGSFECHPCAPGYYGEVAAPSCFPCPPGSTSDWGAKECLPCPAGWTNCTTECPAGYYFYNISDWVVCFQCPPGSFSSAGSTQCSQCDPGYFAPNAASSLCQSCPIGSYSYNSSPCTACPPGSFSSTNATVNCSYCEPGSYAPFEGSSSCMSCPAGFYSSSNGSAYCSTCQVGPIRVVFHE